MVGKYFVETNTLLINFADSDIVETTYINENILVELGEKYLT